MNVADLGIQIAIKIQTSGAHRNPVVWTVNQSFPPKGVQPISDNTPGAGNLYNMFTALRLDGSVMQQCLLTEKHALFDEESAICVFAPLPLRRV